jgi:hypothetical protein
LRRVYTNAAGISVTIPAYAFHTSVSESLVERRALAWKSQQHEATLFEGVYIDETSQTGHRFLVLGGIVIPRTFSAQFEADIIEARSPRLLPVLNSRGQAKEIAWNEISKGDFDAYKKVVDAYFSFAGKHLKSGLDTVEFYCSVVDTAVPGRRYIGRRGQLGFNREIYFHCMSIGRRHRHKLFHVYPDNRSTDMTMDRMKVILCRGIRKEGDTRDWPFRRVQF